MASGKKASPSVDEGHSQVTQLGCIIAQNVKGCLAFESANPQVCKVLQQTRIDTKCAAKIFFNHRGSDMAHVQVSALLVEVGQQGCHRFG